MILSLFIGLGINIFGVFSLYLPINFLMPQEIIKKTRDYLKRKFPSIRRHLQRLENMGDSIEDGRLFVNDFREKRKEDIFKLVEAYEYDYLFVFLLSCLPIPFLGTFMTVVAIFVVETLRIRYGILLIVASKIIKVFALASIAYFAYFLK